MRAGLTLMIITLLLGGCSSMGPTTTAPGSGPAQVLLQQAQALKQQGQLDRAIALTERAVRIEPRNAYAWYELALLYSAQGEHAKANQFAHRSIQLANENQALIRANQRLIERP